MTDKNWIGLLVALIGGGAMGAIIKIIYDLKQGKIQNIGHRLRLYPLFHYEESFQDFEAVVTVTHNGSATEYRNLFVTDLTLTNRSNRDFSEFEFGMTLRENICIHAAWEDPDQHHSITLIEPVSPSSPKSSLKISAKPFNRGDAYSVRLYLTSEHDGREPSPPQLTSPHPIRFVDETYRGKRREALLAWSTSFVSILAALVAWLLPHSGLVEQFRDKPAINAIEREVVFPSRSPFPLHFGNAVPGMKLSEVRSALPQGELTDAGYVVKVESGPFSRALYDFLPRGDDPSIDRVIFLLRDDDAKSAVLKALLEAFSAPNTSEVQGTRLTWLNANGFKLTLGEFYMIEPAEKASPEQSYDSKPP